MRSLPQLIALAALVGIAVFSLQEDPPGAPGAPGAPSPPASVADGWEAAPPIRFVSHDWIETTDSPQEVPPRNSLLPAAVGAAVSCPNGGGSPCRNCQLFALWKLAF